MIGIEAIVITALLTTVLHAPLIRFAGRLGLVDHPVGRKDHAAPIPVVGGIAMWFGLAGGLLIAGPIAAASLGLLGAGALLVLLGALDDRLDLSWRFRILAQVMAAAVLASLGGVELQRLGFADPPWSLTLGWLSLPITVFAVVGLINAVNMVDGVDGLAGTLVFSSLIMMALIGADRLPQLAIQLMVASAAVLVFLSFNLRLPGRARALTFMGNSGSALLGLLLAWAAIRLTHDEGSQITPALAPWLVALPILDCLALIARRLSERRSPFAADRRHFHHLLIDRGCSVSLVVAIGLVIHVGLALLGLGLHAAGVPDIGLIATFVLLIGVHYWVSGALRGKSGATQLVTIASIVPRDHRM